MILKDLIYISFKAFKKESHKTKFVIAVFTVAILIFNIIFSLFSYVKASSEDTITENENLKYMQVEPTTEKFSESDIKFINSIDGVEVAFDKLNVDVGIEYDNCKIYFYFLILN